MIERNICKILGVFVDNLKRILRPARYVACPLKGEQ